MLQHFVVFWTCYKHDKKIFFVTHMSEYFSVDLSCHESIPLTFLEEHCKASKYKDVSKQSVHVWFKDMQVDFNRIQGAHIQYYIFVDDSPHKNLLNNPFNVDHPYDREEPAVSYK